MTPTIRPIMLRYYLDEHLPRRVKQELEKRGVACLMAVDAGHEGWADSEHLKFATQHEYVVVTRDGPFAGRAMQDGAHMGLICWTGRDTDFGGMVTALAAFADAHTPEQTRGHVFWLKA